MNLKKHKNKIAFRVQKLAIILPAVALAYSVILMPSYAQQIVPDGMTKTVIEVNGNTTNVSTSTVKGDNAFNSFSKFNVDRGNTVNLVVPGSVENLISVVHSEKTSINGVLNALKNGKIGGNVFIVNPYGIMVGAEGVVNVGSLTNVTPTKEFTDNFFDAPGIPNESSVHAVLSGTAPKNPEAEVIINGVINVVGSLPDDKTGKPFENVGEIMNIKEMEEMSILIVDISESPAPGGTPPGPNKFYDSAGDDRIMLNPRYGGNIPEAPEPGPHPFPRPALNPGFDGNISESPAPGGTPPGPNAVFKDHPGTSGNLF